MHQPGRGVHDGPRAHQQTLLTQVRIDLVEDLLAPCALPLQGAFGAGKAALALVVILPSRRKTHIAVSPDESAIPQHRGRQDRPAMRPRQD